MTMTIDAAPAYSPGPLPLLSTARHADDGRGLSETRQRVLHAVQQFPGATVQEVAANLGLAHATANHHLKGLTRKNVITRTKDGRNRRHYWRPEAATFPSQIRAFLRERGGTSIISYLLARGASNEPLTVNHMARDLALSHGYLMRMLKRMADVEAVDIQRPANRYYIRGTRRLLELGPDVVKGRGSE